MGLRRVALLLPPAVADLVAHAEHVDGDPGARDLGPAEEDGQGPAHNDVRGDLGVLEQDTQVREDDVGHDEDEGPQRHDLADLPGLEEARQDRHAARGRDDLDRARELRRAEDLQRREQGPRGDDSQLRHRVDAVLPGVHHHQRAHERHAHGVDVEDRHVAVLVPQDPVREQQRHHRDPPAHGGE